MLSESFFERMKNILGDDFAAFSASLNEPPVRAVRVNRIKCASPEPPFDRLSLSPLSYAHGGYILNEDIQIGNTPEHHSGMIYVQDPGAMATVNALDIKQGWQVADLCAAPGGKSGQLAEKIGNGGFLLSNEYVPKRAKILVGNLERLGVGSAMVTSLDTGELAELFPEFFDLVLADAPCSGEGMLRKYDAASEEWSVENVQACALRQNEILDNAARMVAPGGYLLYSTCTYSEEENEEQITRLISRHPELTLCEVKDELIAATAPGIYREGRPRDISKTRRFYPHVSRGEGQYIALLKKDGEAAARRTPAYRDAARPLPKEMRAVIEKFFSESLNSTPKGRLALVGDNAVLIPHSLPVPSRSVFMSGVLIGEIRGKILHPSHQFTSVFGNSFKNRIELSSEDIKRYIGGEEISLDTDKCGWCAVTYRGATLGLGKISGSVMKNHYPKGLRSSSVIIKN